MLQPKRSKYRKSFRGNRRGVAIRGSVLTFGEYGLKAVGGGWLKANQIEAARRTITNSLKRKGRVWLRVFPDKPVTARAAGQRMGSGKGDVDHFVAVVLPGRVLLELAGVPKDQAIEAFQKASAKLPFKTRIITKEEEV